MAWCAPMRDSGPCCGGLSMPDQPGFQKGSRRGVVHSWQGWLQLAVTAVVTGTAVAMAPLPTTRAVEILQGPGAGPEPPGEFQARVLSIGDGDTIRVLQGDRRITVRLACIDAPEMAQSPWGAMARGYLAQRLPLGSRVTIRPQAIDHYGRTVAEVIGELNFNLAMVEDGQAFAYRRYLQACDAQAYLEAEFRASRHRYGIWQPPGGIERPWLFRRAHHHPGQAHCRTDGNCRLSGAEVDRRLRASTLGFSSGVLAP